MEILKKSVLSLRSIFQGLYDNETIHEVLYFHEVNQLNIRKVFWNLEILTLQELKVSHLFFQILENWINLNLNFILELFHRKEFVQPQLLKEKLSQIRRMTVLKIYFKFYLLVKDEHLIRVHKLVCVKILQQKLLGVLHIIIYKKLHQFLIFVNRIKIEKILL
jgi:hypothetical protein